MQRKNIYLWLILIVSNSASAAIISSDAPQWYAGAALGLGLVEHPKTQTISNGPGYPDDSYQNPSINNSTEILLSGGHEWIIAQHYLDMGLLFESGLSPQTQTGTIQEFSLPGYENYTYRYKVAHRTLLVTGEWNILTTQHLWQPYLTAGLGISKNTANDYSETAEPGIHPPRTSMGYADHSNIAAAFMAGLGIKYMLTQTWQLDANYHYLSAGSATLGPSSISGESGLKQVLNYNTFTLGLRHLF